MPTWYWIIVLLVFLALALSMWGFSGLVLVGMAFAAAFALLPDKIFRG